MDEALRFSQSHGVRAGCQALDLPPSSLYREKLRRERPALDPRPRAASPRALSPPEREAVVEVLHSRQFIDKKLLDEGRYLCSIRTMYRILAKRRQRRHPQYSKPELLATGPNQCWSCWEYVILSRWAMVAAKAPAWPSHATPSRRSYGWSHPACRSWLVDEFQRADGRSFAILTIPRSPCRLSGSGSAAIESVSGETSARTAGAGSSPRAASPRALSPPEREAVVEVLHSRQFIDKAPAAAAWQTGATPDFQSSGISCFSRSRTRGLRTWIVPELSVRCLGFPYPLR